MAYEVFSRKTSRVGTPMMTITKLGRMAFNNAATARLAKDVVEYVVLLFDKENRMVAVKPISKKDPRAYHVSYGKKGNGAGFSAKTFLDFIELDYASESRNVPVEWNAEQNMYEAQFPAEYFKDARQRRLLPVEPARAHSRS